VTPHAPRTWLIPLFALLVLLAAIYGPGVGHGFVKDDVVWVEANDVSFSSWEDLKALAFRTHGFYRPLVSASFAVDRALYDLWPVGYGITNLCLLGLSTLALAWVATGLGLSRPAAIAAAGIWALNFHGINMAVLWLSGRTALWLVLCALLAAGLFVRKRWALAGVAVLFAAFSKEEAVMLPVIFAGWTIILHGRGVREVVRATWAAWVAVAIYLALRSSTNAMTPSTSPSFYSFTFAPLDVVKNVLEYLDRAATFSTVVLLLACLVAWRLPDVTARTRRLAVAGAIWFAGAYALTVFLPVRSSLYACLPSVGAALIIGSLLQDLWSARGVDVAHRRRLIAAAIVTPLVLLPVYWARNTRWVEIADLSRETFALLDATEGRTASSIVFEDDRATRRSFANTYGNLLPVAVKLATGRDIPVAIEPPLPGEPDNGGRPTGPDRTGSVRIRLRNGHVSRVDAEPR
jgi:hypothetical protein